MTCPHYQGGTRCGFKSDAYELTENTTKTLCNGDYTKCPIFIEHVYPNSEEARRVAHLGVLERINAIVKNLERKTHMPGVGE